MTKKNENINVEETKVEQETIEEETVETVDAEEVEVKESKFTKVKNFVKKHKKEILIGGLTLVAGAAGYALGVKNNDDDFIPANNCLEDSYNEPLALEAHDEVESSEEEITE